MTVLDAQMLGVALPGIARDLGISPASATWLLNAYQLAVVSTLLPLSSLAEIVGFRRVYLAGFARLRRGLGRRRPRSGLRRAGRPSACCKASARRR